jgi:hypothetical protein
MTQQRPCAHQVHAFSRRLPPSSTRDNDLLWRGTDGLNPVPSSGESAANSRSAPFHSRRMAKITAKVPNSTPADPSVDAATDEPQLGLLLARAPSEGRATGRLLTERECRRSCLPLECARRADDLCGSCGWERRFGHGTRRTQSEPAASARFSSAFATRDSSRGTCQAVPTRLAIDFVNC